MLEQSFEMRTLHSSVSDLHLHLCKREVNERGKLFIVSVPSLLLLNEVVSLEATVSDGAEVFAQVEQQSVAGLVGDEHEESDSEETQH